MRLGQPPRDHLAHRGVRHDAMRCGDGHLRRRCNDRRRAGDQRRGCGGGRRTRRSRRNAGLRRGCATLLRRLDIRLDDAAVRTTALQRGQIDSCLLRHAPCQWRYEDAPALGIVPVARLRRWLRIRRSLSPGAGPGRRGLGCLGDRLGPVGRHLLRRIARLRLRLRIALLRLRRRGRLRLRPARRNLFALLHQHRNRLVDLHALGPVANKDLAEHTFIDRLDFHRRLVGLDLGDHVAGTDLLAFLFQPA